MKAGRCNRSATHGRRRWGWLALASAGLLVPRAALACYNFEPGGTAAVRQASIAAGVTALAALACVALWARRRRLGALAAVPALLLAVHPRWTVTPWGGDCGAAMRTSALGVAALAAAVLTAYALLTRRRGPGPVES